MIYYEYTFQLKKKKKKKNGNTNVFLRKCIKDSRSFCFVLYKVCEYLANNNGRTWEIAWDLKWQLKVLISNYLKQQMKHIFRAHINIQF